VIVVLSREVASLSVSIVNHVVWALCGFVRIVHVRSGVLETLDLRNEKTGVNCFCSFQTSRSSALLSLQIYVGLVWCGWLSIRVYRERYIMVGGWIDGRVFFFVLFFGIWLIKIQKLISNS